MMGSKQAHLMWYWWRMHKSNLNLEVGSSESRLVLQFATNVKIKCVSLLSHLHLNLVTGSTQKAQVYLAPRVKTEALINAFAGGRVAFLSRVWIISRLW